MSVNVNSFRELTLFLSNKAQAGGVLTPAQFNEIADRAQLQLFERDYQTFLAIEEISEFLKTFLKNTIFSVPATGVHAYPSDYQHLSSLRKYFVKPNGVGMMIPVEEIKNVNYGFAQISSLKEPSLRFPKYNEFSNVVRFLPKNIGIVECDYFAKPVPPIWGFTIVSGRPVYSPAASTDFQWNAYSENEVAGIFLGMIGVNIREGDLSAWSNQFRNENSSKL